MGIFGYTGNICLWDQFSVSFRLFVGFADDETHKILTDLSF